MKCSIGHTVFHKVKMYSATFTAWCYSMHNNKKEAVYRLFNTYTGTVQVQFFMPMFTIELYSIGLLVE